MKKQVSLMKHVKHEVKRELRVWHLLIGVLLVGLCAGYVVTHGKSGRLQMCHERAQEIAKEKIVQRLEVGENTQLQNEMNDSNLYKEEYQNCLSQVGL